MEVLQARATALADLGVETGREGTRWLTAVARWRLPHCARRAARHHAWASIRGLRRPMARTNGWQLAEVHGEATPYGRQHWLGRARWEADAVCDDWRAYLVKSIGAPQAGRGRDETGVRKKGPQAAGVARPSRGTAGRGEPGQIGVLLAYASVPGHAWLECALSRPKAWADDRERCAPAGVPAEQRVATTPQLAPPPLQGAFEAGGPAAWVPGDSV